MMPRLVALEGLPRRVRCERERLGLSPAQLARRVGVDREAIYRFERGRAASPSAVFVLKLSIALGVSMDYLLLGEVDGVKDLVACYAFLSSKRQEALRLVALGLGEIG